MLKNQFGDAIAAEMDKILRDAASETAIEKQASEFPIKRVSESEQPTEIEIAVETAITPSVEPVQEKTAADHDCLPCKGYYIKDKTAGACTCACKSLSDCKNGCECHSAPAKPTVDWHKVKSSEIINALVKVSSDLDDLGFAKLATVAILMASKVAKPKKSKKDSKKSKEMDKSKSKKTDKAKSKDTKKSKEMDKSKSKKTDKK